MLGCAEQTTAKSKLAVSYVFLEPLPILEQNCASVLFYQNIEQKRSYAQIITQQYINCTQPLHKTLSRTCHHPQQHEDDESQLTMIVSIRVAKNTETNITKKQQTIHYVK
jgi:hypothetical protein